MGIVKDFEHRLEGAVEGFFARAFRSGLQPVELAKAVQRYASHYKQVGVEGIVVPNVYRIEIAEDDAERFRGYGEALRHELAGVVHRTARERGWQLAGPVRVETRVNDGLKVGTYEIRGKVEAGPTREANPAGAPAIEPTESLRAASEGTPLVRVLTGSGPGHAVRLPNGGVFGRLPACEVTLDDPSVSRRHARLERAADGWYVEDLGSTNGVKVNGARVERSHLRDGDEVTLGSVRLAFSLDTAAANQR